MNISSIQEQILKLKKEKDVCILAHSYQAHEILEIADYTGDSYKLSVDASKAENKNILMCGVRFMAETCKILSPEKTVYLAQPVAGCSMADQMDKQLFLRLKNFAGFSHKSYAAHKNVLVFGFACVNTQLVAVARVICNFKNFMRLIAVGKNTDILFLFQLENLFLY